MAREITVKLFVGNQPIETLTEEQRQRMADRLSEAMSIYYTAHPEEYKNLKE